MKKTNRLGLCIAAFVISSTLSGIAEEAKVPVNIDNFVRARMDDTFRSVAKQAGGVGKFKHDRAPISIEEQHLVRMNRDTPHSQGVFDLSEPLTLVIPDPGDRFFSVMVNSQDHHIHLLAYEPGRYTFTQEEVGTRYIWVNFRIYVDESNPDDLAEMHRFQDGIQIIQKDPGKLELPNWDVEQLNGLVKAITTIGPWVPDSRGMFGSKDEVEPVRHWLGTAFGMGGNKPEDAIYIVRFPEKNDGKTLYELTVDEVPVDAFWSISIYNGDGFFEEPIEAANVNSYIAKKNPDGTTTVRFGGDPKAPNYLRIMPGWNYQIRLYRPRKEALDGTWTFPEAKEVGKEKDEK